MITIIILLILAGISIAMLTGENGLLTKASQAKEQSDYKNAEEKVRLAVTEYYAKLKEETMYRILSNIEGLESIEPDDEQAGMPYEIIVDGYVFIVSENEETKNIEINYQKKSNGIIPEIIAIEQKVISDKEAKISVEAKTEDEEGIEKIILIKNGVEFEIKQVEGENVKNIKQDFTVTGNGTYKVKVVGKNKRRVISEEVVVTGLINMTATLKAGTVVDATVTLTIEAKINEGDIVKIQIYNGQSLVGEIPVEQKKEIQETYQVDSIPFYVENNYVAQIVANTDEKLQTNSVTINNKDIINTVNDLRKLAEVVNGGESFQNKTIKLNRDINVANGALVPIGTIEAPFLGTFRGNKKTISGFSAGTVVDDTYVLCGLFGHVGTTGRIEQLIILNSRASNNTIYRDKEGIAGIACAWCEGTLSAVSVRGNSSCNISTYTTNWVGGVCGYLADGARAYYCSSRREVQVWGNSTSSSTNYLGGLIGGSEGEINHCYSRAKVGFNANSSNENKGGIVGGFVAKDRVLISNSYEDCIWRR